MHRGGRLSRALVGILTLAVVAVGLGGAPPAQADDLPVVSAIDAFGPSAYAYIDCDGVAQTDAFLDGGVLLVREGPTADALTVPISWSGSLAASLVDPPAEATFAAGSDTAEVYVEVDAIATGDIVLTVEPGPDHTVGESPITIPVDAEPLVIADCNEDLGTPPNGTDDQTIEVGEQPEPIGFFEEGDAVDPDEPVTDDLSPLLASRADTDTDADLDLVGYSTPVVNGSIPPGLTYERDVWGGAATTPGTYEFDVRVCFDEALVGPEPDAPAPAALDAMLRRVDRAIPSEVCFGYVDVRIVVEEETTTPPPEARPADPVQAPARFTG